MTTELITKEQAVEMLPKSAKELLKTKGIKDTLLLDGEWVPLQMECISDK